MENKLKVNVNMDGFIESISNQIDRLNEILEIITGEDKKPSLKEQRIEVLKNFIANDLFDTTYNVEDVKVINFEVSSDPERYLRTDSSFEVDGKHIRCLSYDNSIIAMDNLERIKNYDGDVCSLIGLYHLKYLNNVVVRVRDLNQKAKKEPVKTNKTNNTQLTMDYIKDILIESDDRLLFIYWDEMGFDLNEVRVEHIVSNLERKGYSCRISSKGIFVERYDYIKKELSDMLDLNSKDIIKGCRVEYYEGNNIYGNIYYNEETEDSYSVHIYNNFEDYLDDVLELVEGNWAISRELDNNFYMIVLKNVPNIDMDCDDEE